MRRGLASALLALSLVTTALSAAAEPTPQDIAQARELGGQAQAAYDAGKLGESEKLWIAASGLYSAAPTLTLGLARTQAKLGKLVFAQESYNRIIREQGEATNLSPAFKDALESARGEVGAVSARIANVVIVVEGPETPKVTIDGQPVSSAGLGLKRPVDPGAHVVRAEAPGWKPGETSFQVAESGLAEAKLKLEKAADAPVAAAGDVGFRTDATPTNRSHNQTYALVAFGVGGAGLVFGAVTGLIALGKHSDLEDQCPGGRCPPTVKEDLDSYKTMGTLSTVGFIVGGVGAAAGAVLWLTAPKERTAMTWSPYVGATGGGVAGRF